MTETEWAIRNLELAGWMSKESDYDGMIGEAVKKLLIEHSKEGHSGASHHTTVSLFNLVAHGRHALTIEFWNERFADYNKLATSMGGEPWTEEDFEKNVMKKPDSKKESK